MNQEKYRKAIDSLPFSADFEARTIGLLRQRTQCAAGKGAKMIERPNRKKIFWRMVAAAALIAAVSASGYAAARLLKPSEVARYFHAQSVSDLFESQDDITINETLPLGDYTATLFGMVTGESNSLGWGTAGLALNPQHTYIALAVQRNDGAPVDIFEFSSEYVVTPLVSGYEPSWTWDQRGHIDYDNIPVSGFILQDQRQDIVVDGVLYCLYDAKNLELFADHTVYFAVYYGAGEKEDNTVDLYFPSTRVFSMAEDGSLAFREDFSYPHAMFVLPLDERKADPKAARALLERLTQSEREEWAKYCDCE